jgi:hypothetical protein
MRVCGCASTSAVGARHHASLWGFMCARLPASADIGCLYSVSINLPPRYRCGSAQEMEHPNADAAMLPGSSASADHMEVDSGAVQGSIRRAGEGQRALLIVPPSFAHIPGGRGRLGERGTSPGGGPGGLGPVRQWYASECMYQLVCRSMREWVRLTALYNAEKSDAGSNRATAGDSAETVAASSASAACASGSAENDAGGGNERDVGRGAAVEGNRPLDQLRHLRHTLITCVSSVCPEYGMRTP